MVELLSGPWGPLVIFLLRICDVSMATMRMLLIVRGSRRLAPFLSFFEILLWVIAVGVVVRNLTSPLHVLSYAGGFAAGTAVGMWLEGKLALGICTVRAILRQPAEELATTLRSSGFGVTELTGEGREGPVEILYTVVRRRHVPAVLGTIDAQAPDAFVTVQNDATVRRGWIQGMRRR